MSRTRSACVAASGVTLSVLTPASRIAATRSATKRGPISEVPASSSAGTSPAASSLRPAR